MDRSHCHTHKNCLTKRPSAGGSNRAGLATVRAKVCMLAHNATQGLSMVVHSPGCRVGLAGLWQHQGSLELDTELQGTDRALAGCRSRELGACTSLVLLGETSWSCLVKLTKHGWVIFHLAISHLGWTATGPSSAPMCAGLLKRPFGGWI